MTSEYAIEKASCIVKQMLSDRKYELDDQEEFTFQSIADKEKKVKVFFCVGTKLNIDTMKSFVAILQKNNFHHAIIIYDNVITSSTRKLLDHLWDIHVEVFHIDEMQFNLTHHSLYAKHELLDTEGLQEIKHLMKKLPIILKTDPVVRYFDFQKHSVLKIYRLDGTISYRIVH